MDTSRQIALFYFPVTMFPPMAQLHCSTIQNYLIRHSDEGLALNVSLLISLWLQI